MLKLFRKMDNLLPIVILHGWGAQASRWQKVKNLLKDHQFNVFVPDLPDFGKAPLPPTAWGLDDYAVWAIEQTNNLNWPKFILIGHSFGGSVAVKVAVNYPDRVAKLVLVNSAGIRPSPDSLKRRIWLLTLHFGRLILTLPFLRNYQNLMRRVLYKILGSADYLKAEGIQKEILKKILVQDIREDLPKIQTPTLIIWAEKDRQTPLFWAKIFAGKIPDAKLQIVKGANHIFPYLKAEKFVDLLENFLQS